MCLFTEQEVIWRDGKGRGDSGARGIIVDSGCMDGGSMGQWDILPASMYPHTLGTNLQFWRRVQL